MCFPLKNTSAFTTGCSRPELPSLPILSLRDPATDEDVLLVHTPRYVEKLKTGTLSQREQMELEVPFSPALVKAFWLAAGGSILAADYALSDGIAISIGGGFHHAFPDHGEGFCMIHDVAVAIRRMQRDGKIRYAMTVDCDVHQGNGTAAIFAGTRTASEPLPSVPTSTLNPAKTRMQRPADSRRCLHYLASPGKQLPGVETSLFDRHQSPRRNRRRRLSRMARQRAQLRPSPV